MSSAVLDASAILGVIFKEEGYERVMIYLTSALVSSVNLAEVVSKAVDKHMTCEAIRWMIRGLQIQPVPFDEELAFITGSLREPTRALRLSLGDRACLALGLQTKLPVLTFDRRWQDAEVGVAVKLISRG